MTDKLKAAYAWVKSTSEWITQGKVPWWLVPLAVVVLVAILA